jgi:hypothetical protein
LAQLLRELGFAEVELHREPKPLNSWNGNPTGASAEVIIRRKSLGSTADDMGFARRADGTYEAVISDIHLFRFDRRFFEKLEKLHASSPAAEAEPEVKEAARPEGFSLRPAPEIPVAPRETPRSAPPPREREVQPPPRAERTREFGSPNVEEEVNILLGPMRKHRPYGLCGVVFIGAAALLVIAFLSNGGRNFFGFVIFGFAIYLVAQATKQVRGAIRAEQIAQAFLRRFPADSTLRDEARRRLGHLAAKGKPDERKILLRVLDRTRARAS